MTTLMTYESPAETVEFDAIADFAWGPGWRGRDSAGVTEPVPFDGHPQPRRLRSGDPLPAGWRWPTRQEVQRDQRLGPVAVMPIVVLDPESTAPLSLRVDAWCHRVDRLLAQRATDERRAAA